MPALITSILFLFFIMLLAGMALLFANLQFLREHLTQILILLVVSLFSVLSSNGKYFMGLEYEDAYIFTANSRYLLFNQDLSVEPLQTHTCVLGSMSDCKTEATYGGHFLALPSLAYLTHRLLGYHPYAVCWINLVASLISVLVLYFLCLLLTRDRACSLVASLIYAICPAMNVFHTSALAETTSSLLLLIYVFCFLSLFIHKEDFGRTTRWLLWTVLGVSLALALLTKRENLILLAVPVFAVPGVFRERSPAAKAVLVWTCITVTFALVLVSGFKILQIETGESGDIGAPTFSLRYSLGLIPLFSEALLTFKWFTISSALFLCGVATVFKRSLRSGWTAMVGLFLAYFFVYSGHYRSYYFVHYGSVTPFESLRYITNFFPLFAAVAGLGANEAIRWIRKIGGRWRNYDRLVFGGIAIVWVLISVGMTPSLRNEWQQVEWENRIAPVALTLQNVSESQDYVVTDLSVVFQVFGAPTMRIVDAYSIGTVIPTNVLLQNLREARTVWWLRRNATTAEEESDMKRYPGFYQFVHKYEPRECTKILGPLSLCRLSIT